MQTRGFKFNVLPFQPGETYTFYFSGQADEGLSLILEKDVPPEVIQHFGKQDYYYTSFEKERKGFLAVTKPSLVKETNGTHKGKNVSQGFSLAILKVHFNLLVFGFCKKKGLLVKPNFLKATEVWLPVTKEPCDEDFCYFEKFCVQARYKKTLAGWVLLVSYEGRARVLKKPVGLLGGLNQNQFSWVIFDHGLYSYEALPESGLRNLDMVFPVVNYDLMQALDLKEKSDGGENKYRRYWEKISLFHQCLLDKPDFKEIIPLSPGGFLGIHEKTIGFVNPNSNILLFGNGSRDIIPYQGLKENGPYELKIPPKVHFFFILSKEDARAGEILHHYLMGNRTRFRGLTQFIGVPYLTEKSLSIVFENREDPWPEIYREVLNRSFSKECLYFALYISPFSKHETDEKRKSVYYLLKELLLERGVLSQAVEAEKVLDDERKASREKSYHLNLPNMAVAILAKLGGTPWKLNIPINDELIVGVGAFKSRLTNIKYFGSAFSFANNGKFNHFECYKDSQIKELNGSIIRTVKEYVRVHPEISRLIIHFYKETCKKECWIIEKGLRALNLNIPVFIVTINRTESEDIVGFDHSWPELMPCSGTFIRIGYNRFLLYNNTRYPDAYFRAREGYPFPIKLKIFCTDSALARDYQMVKGLVEQVYQFSRMYWKSVRQQNLPVTIKYPELIAKMIPHFEGEEIPEFGNDKLWFL